MLQVQGGLSDSHGEVGEVVAQLRFAALTPAQSWQPIRMIEGSQRPRPTIVAPGRPAKGRAGRTQNHRKVTPGTNSGKEKLLLFRI